MTTAGTSPSYSLSFTSSFTLILNIPLGPLFSYFTEFILHQMVPFDDKSSPYRKFLVPWALSSRDLMMTVLSITAENMYARGMLDKHVVENIKDNFDKRQLVTGPPTLDLYLNLLMQVSYSLFSYTHFRNQKVNRMLLRYMKYVSTALFHHESNALASPAHVFVAQRLVFNDIFVCCCNDMKPVTTPRLVEVLAEFEASCPFNQSLLHIIGCSADLMRIFHRTQLLTHHMSQSRAPVETRTQASMELLDELELARLTALRRCSTAGEENAIALRNLIQLHYLTACVLIVTRVALMTPESSTVLAYIERACNLLQDNFLVGLGPDSCVSFPAYVFGTYAVSQHHKEVLLQVCSLSEWHLKLGGLKFLKEKLRGLHEKNKDFVLVLY